MIHPKYVLVMSGKGGVGKSTVSANIARAFSKKHGRVGLLDLDLTGPSIPTLFGIKDRDQKGKAGKIVPQVVDNVEIVSLGLMLSDPNDAVVWRGPKKNNMINQFFEMIDWHCGTVIVDLPPGTSDEHLTTFDVLKKKQLEYKVIIVTTPNLLAIADVKKGIKLCQQENADIVGVVENFCGVLCPCCGKVTPFIGDKSDEMMNEEFHLPILVKIPFLPEAAKSNDKGEECDKLLSYFEEIVNKIE